MERTCILASLAAALSLAACTNLDEEVYSSIRKDDFFASEEQLVIYSARAYTSLQAWGSEQSMWTMNLQLGNEVAVPMNSVGEWKDERYGQLQTHRIQPNNKLVQQSWNYCFDGIAACNDVIYEIERSSGTFDGKERVLAEIRVLRAWYYFLAVDCWGNVPYSVSKEETGYPEQKDRRFMFSFIEKEIRDNIDALADDSSGPYYGRVTRGMANTLLAKLYLNAEVWTGTPMWAQAEAACKEVMDSGKYRLATDYKDNFSVHDENSPEAVFSIPYSTVYTESDHNSFVLFVLTLDGYMTRSFNIGSSGWDGFVGQPDFIASYDPADKRLHATWLIGQQYDVNGAKVTYKEGDTVKDYVIDPEMEERAYTSGRRTAQGAPIGKWEIQTDGLISSDQTSMENDFHVFRYADVVLMYVEALVRQGRASEAAGVADFQQLRARAGLAPMTAAELTLDNLYLERSHELAVEGWARQDLIRFGKYLDKWWAKPAGQDYMLLLPVPDDKRATNPNLQQNPGY